MKLRRKYAGLNTHRLASNHLEAQFAIAWQQQNEVASAPGMERADTLDYILHQGDQRFPVRCSDRDRQVANSVIQWLGSPVGEDFVLSVLAGDDDETAKTAARNLGMREGRGFPVVDPTEIEIVD